MTFEATVLFNGLILHTTMHKSIIHLFDSIVGILCVLFCLSGEGKPHPEDIVQLKRKIKEKPKGDYLTILVAIGFCQS